MLLRSEKNIKHTEGTDRPGTPDFRPIWGHQSYTLVENHICLLTFVVLIEKSGKFIQIWSHAGGWLPNFPLFSLQHSIVSERGCVAATVRPNTACITGTGCKILICLHVYAYAWLRAFIVERYLYYRHGNPCGPLDRNRTKRPNIHCTVGLKRRRAAALLAALHYSHEFVRGFRLGCVSLQ